ncbi:Hypothetical protein PHPALM_14096 [Phytophthora palmivora]|uniref:Reverse transcriptase n=1 Tax=Phytophthora palmivora TaxID=4796 RepID=A0A2P4XVM0_9STRA|nr:Hypothetical protein PHPALM_14096 [Phytophthora palmivora]
MLFNAAVDQDGDVEMRATQPAFEYIKPQRLTDLGQPALFSIKSSMEPRILEHLAHYEFRTTVEEVTDARLQEGIKRRAGTLMNDHVPDVTRLFSDNLKMDMKVSDIHSRVAKYFMDFDQLVDEHGLVAWVGRGPATDAAGRQRMKVRCKLLISNLFPMVLRVDIERLVAVTHQHAKMDDVVLYELIITRAKSQQHFHTMQAELKRDDAPRGKSAGGMASGVKQPSKAATKIERAKVERKAAPTPPRSGCLICKGPHWAKDCPIATDEQKQDILRDLKARRALKDERAKVVRVVRAGEGRRVCINGVMDVPLCPDTEADSNIISQALVDELRSVECGLILQPLEPAVTVQVAGGAHTVCRDAVTLDLRIETATGPLHLAGVSYIGIDIDRLFDQLASGHVGGADDDDITIDTPKLGFSVNDEEVDGYLNKMLDAAGAAGFEPVLLKDLRKLVFEYADVWRVPIGDDPPADVEPLKVKLQEGAQPYRSGTRKYPPAQRKFLREFVLELERHGLARRNNASHWACPALPVKKPHSDEFRCTVDYRPTNKCTVPLAGATPNLSSATQSVRGAYGFGLFDLFKGFWQLPLHADSQEVFSFVTEDGVFTPTRTVVWCGKVIDGTGVQHSPDRLAALTSLALPPTAAALQQFLCAANWLRESMIDYARVVGPLQSKLEAVMAQLIGLLTTSTKMFFPGPDAVVCMFSDAALGGWAVIVSQVRHWAARLPVTEQAHELLVCRGGLFTEAQVSWSIVEKEAYPVGRACGDLAYLLDREKGVQIYCDHANLIHIFSPAKTVKPHLRGKLQRWALHIVGVRYTIEHIKGDDNVWADLVSRWGQADAISEPSYAVKRVMASVSDAIRETHDAASDSGDSVEAVEQEGDDPWTISSDDASAAYWQVPLGESALELARRVTTRSTQRISMLQPLQDSNFEWPSEDAIRDQQQRYRASAPRAADADGLVRVDAKFGSLRMPVNYCNVCWWSLTVLHKATGAATPCMLLLRSACRGKLLIRPWGPTSTAVKRNECLHMDYLQLGDSYGASRYVLVLKDELTRYCELVAADTASSATTVQAVLDWRKRFGLPEAWVSDNGSHFKASVMHELADRLKATQKFVPVYTPWINCTVERVNRGILQVLRVMLLELRLDTRNWVHLLPVIQANLNHSAVASLGGHAPVELFTGLPAPALLDSVAIPTADSYRVLPVNLDAVAPQLAKLRAHLQELHRVVVDRKERRRLREIARGKGQECNFAEGDFVLWSRLSHSFMIDHLLTGDEYEVHGSRFKHYCDSDLGSTAEIREHVASQGIVLGVRGFVGHRYDTVAKEWQLHVAWRGLEDTENSWEPFTAMSSDVPALVAEYVHSVDAPELAALL